LEKIQLLVKTKSAEKIRDYSVAFWERLPALQEHEKILKTIEKGEASI
jgi:SWI/SNF-related matrix-associated actin-dependent regulator of chromatin subfamily A member 5